MSNLKVNSINDASGGSNAQLYGVSMRTGGTAWINRIINGDMRIDQRNAGASVTPANSYTVDRWQGVVSQTGKFTVQQNAGGVTLPPGFKNYLGVTSASAYSVLTGDYFMLSQRIEGYNFADFNFGTSNAQSFTLSFWVRSSLTGTFGGSFQGAASATLRSYPFSYTISAANTWEYKTVVVAGDTFSNTWDSTNGIGLFVNFGLGAGASASGTAGSWSSANYANATGATSVVGTNGATFYITGVQLEAGSVASPFERVDYGRQLIQCQRYLPAINGSTIVGSAWAASATQAYCEVVHQVVPRVNPTGISTSAAASFTIYGSGASSVTPTAVTFNAGGTLASRIGVTTASGLAAGIGTGLFANSSTSQILFTGCEL